MVQASFLLQRSYMYCVTYPLVILILQLLPRTFIVFLCVVLLAVYCSFPSGNAVFW